MFVEEIFVWLETVTKVVVVMPQSKGGPFFFFFFFTTIQSLS